MPVLGIIVVSLIGGGCVTAAAMKVGAANEMPSAYRKIQLSGTTLQILYTPMRWVRQPGWTAIEDLPDRWISVSLDSLSWVAVDRLDGTQPLEVPRECSPTQSTPNPAPVIILHDYRGIFKVWYSPEAPDYEAPLAAYVQRGDSRRLVLVRMNASDGQRAVASLWAVHRCLYDLPWAPYARIALVPFAVVVDIITSPFQLLGLIALAAAGTGH